MLRYSEIIKGLKISCHILNDINADISGWVQYPVWIALNQKISQDGLDIQCGCLCRYLIVLDISRDIQDLQNSS
jgi:hypothetical protein